MTTNENNNNPFMPLIKYFMLSQTAIEHLMETQDKDDIIMNENDYMECCRLTKHLYNKGDRILNGERINTPQAVSPEIRTIIRNHYKNNPSTFHQQVLARQRPSRNRGHCTLCNGGFFANLKKHQARPKCRSQYAKKKAILLIQDLNIKGWDNKMDAHPYIRSYDIIHSCLITNKATTRKKKMTRWIKKKMVDWSEDKQSLILKREQNTNQRVYCPLTHITLQPEPAVSWAEKRERNINKINADECLKKLKEKGKKPRRIFVRNYRQQILKKAWNNWKK